ncbi:class I SAM-dependent methyltransferase [Dactylosporangium darangshiense]|uniref:class I SAM-dependent methyltransferase n=1 Tax=Dactylosporangium darangshiense TaxID=579108 RepID=UPI00362FAC78
MDDPWIALFDRVADSFDTVVPFFLVWRVDRCRVARAGRGARLLDVGAGAGAIALAARRRGYEVCAVDGSAAMVARLSESLPAVQVAEAGALPFDDGTFDVVTAGFVLHLLNDPQAALREFKRVMVPGGLLAFTVVGPPPRGFEPGDRSHELFAEYSRYLPRDGRTDAPFDARGLLAMTGFRDVAEQHLQVELALDEPETMWRWYGTHGTRRFFDELDEKYCEEFRQRLIADLVDRPELVLRRAALLFTAHF